MVNKSLLIVFLLFFSSAAFCAKATNGLYLLPTVQPGLYIPGTVTYPLPNGKKDAATCDQILKTISTIPFSKPGDAVDEAGTMQVRSDKLLESAVSYGEFLALSLRRAQLLQNDKVDWDTDNELEMAAHYKFIDEGSKWFARYSSEKEENVIFGTDGRIRGISISAADFNTSFSAFRYEQFFKDYGMDSLVLNCTYDVPFDALFSQLTSLAKTGQLKNLTFIGVPSANIASFLALLGSNPLLQNSLEHLGLELMDLATPAFANVLGKFKKLSSLSLEGSVILSSVMGRLTQMSSLRALSLKYIDLNNGQDRGVGLSLNDKSAAILQKMPWLEKLNIDGHHMTSKGVAMLATLPRLVNLHMVPYFDYDQFFKKSSIQVFASGFSALQTLSLWDAEKGTRSLSYASLLSLPKLRELGIGTKRDFDTDEVKRFEARPDVRLSDPDFVSW